MTLVRVRHTQPDGRMRWLESVVPADGTNIMVWSTDPTDAPRCSIWPARPCQKVLAWFAERVCRGKVELIEEKTA